MCRQTTCEKCGKITWAGCGAHVDAVMAGVPADRRCRCRETPKKKAEASPRNVEAANSLLNVGNGDRFLRMGLGLIGLMLVFVGPQTPWGWLGLVPLATGFVGFCPLYRLLGMSTRQGVKI